MTPTDPTLFHRTHATAAPYADPTAATLLDAVNTGGAVWCERATGRALLLSRTAPAQRFTGADNRRSIGAMVALGLLRACGEAETGVDCYEGTGERVARLGGAL